MWGVGPGARPGTEPCSISFPNKRKLHSPLGRLLPAPRPVLHYWSEVFGVGVERGRPLHSEAQLWGSQEWRDAPKETHLLKRLRVKPSRAEPGAPWRRLTPVGSDPSLGGTSPPRSEPPLSG